MMLYGKFCVAVLLTQLVGFSTPLMAAEPEQEWRFRVTLNDKDIGYHHFSVKQEGDKAATDIAGRSGNKDRSRVCFWFYTLYQLRLFSVR